MAQRMCSFGTTGAKRSDPSCAPSAGIPRIVWPRGLAHASRDIAPLAVLLCNLCVPSVGGDISVWTPSPTRQVAQIPFKAYQGYLIVVDGRIGNLEHQNLLLDTGSNPSMIDSSVSARLGLQGTARDLSVFNKSFASESITLPDLQFGPVRRENLPVMVANFSVIGSGLGTRIDAVIGLDVLGGTNFTVDYAKQRIFFGASVERYTVPFTAGRQFITVNLRSGARQLHLLLDTGTPQLVLFESHLRGVDYVWSGAMGSGQNVAGNVRFGTVVLSQARIGTLDVGPQRASVVASRTGIESDLDGLMGVSCLRPKRISFDFERQLLGWSD
jgi:hypothetical protein